MTESVLESRQRPLKAAEARLLRARARSLRRRGQRAASVGLWTGLSTIALLWALTLVASDAPVLVITAFWLVAGTVIISWVRHSLGADSRTLDAVADGLESALRRNCALVYDIRASGFVLFDEVEDEGACYAFQLIDKSEIIFLSGQEFYEQPRFPSLDFALVFPLDEADRRVDMLIQKHGSKADPRRRIAASVKRTLNIPEDLQIVTGALDDVEERLQDKREP